MSELRYKKENNKYVYVVSDIHGRIREFNKLLDIIEHDSIGKEYSIYVLGDTIDRSEGGISILEKIFSSENIHLIMGNHEWMMLKVLGDTGMFNCLLENKSINTLDILLSKNNECIDLVQKYNINNEALYWLPIWCYNGGGITIQELMRLSKRRAQRLILKLKQLKYEQYINLDGQKYCLVHSIPSCFVFDPDNIEYNMVWTEMPNIENNRDFIVVFGHRCTWLYQYIRPYKVFIGKGIVGIDCGCASTNLFSRLGCLRLNDFKEYYVKLTESV